jgi:PIN domain nuclease of toxin-antitoxin system
VKLLLDTCAFLWIAGGGRPVPRRVADAYQAASNDVFLSAASAWEIAVTYASGKLLLPVAPQSLVPAERERLGVTWLAIDEESALHVGRLPPLHRDPFDRMLVAQTHRLDAVLVTRDSIFGRYGVETLPA